MSTPPPYNAWLHWNVTYRCNLTCPYCFYVNSLEERGRSRPTLRSVWQTARKILESQPSVLKDYVDLARGCAPAPIRIPELLRSLERTGRTFKIGFAGGEPFLVVNFVDACVAIASRHFVTVTTNLTSGRVAEFARRVPPARVQQIYASVHFSELERLGLNGAYIKNFHMLEKAGFPIQATAVGFPSLVAAAADKKNAYRREGIEIGFIPFVGLWNGRSFPRDYTKDELAAFQISPEHSTPPGGPDASCNAGFSAALVFPGGAVVACPHRKIPLGNVYRGFKFRDVLMPCRRASCDCCFPRIDVPLWESSPIKKREA